MAQTILSVGWNRVIWLGPQITLGTAAWKNNLLFVLRENTARTTLVNFNPLSSVNAVTALEPGQIYLLKVKTEFQLDGGLIALTASLPTAISGSIQLDGPIGESMTEFEDIITTLADTTPTVVFTAGSGAIEYRLAATAQWAALPQSLPASTFMLRVQRPSATPFSCVLTLTRF